MIRILLDESFPRFISAVAKTDNVEFQSLENAGAESDSALVARAASGGCQALALLGRRSLGRSELLTAAQRVRLPLLVTNTEDLLEGAAHIERRIGAIPELLVEHGEVTVLYARHHERFNYAELLEALIDPHPKSRRKPEL